LIQYDIWSFFNPISLSGLNFYDFKGCSSPWCLSHPVRDVYVQLELIPSLPFTLLNQPMRPRMPAASQDDGSQMGSQIRFNSFLVPIEIIELVKFWLKFKFKGDPLVAEVQV
jgi:hypothetical protein